MWNVTQENSKQLVWPDVGRYNSENLMWPEDVERNLGELRTTRVARLWEI